jgi:hypothetical protein
MGSTPETSRDRGTGELSSDCTDEGWNAEEIRPATTLSFRHALDDRRVRFGASSKPVVTYRT